MPSSVNKSFPGRTERLSGFAEARPEFQHRLLAEKILDPDDLFRAQAIGAGQNARLADILQSLGLASEEAVLAAQGDQAAIPVVDLLFDPPTPDLPLPVGPDVAVRHGFMPWRQDGDITLFAVADPADIPAIRTLLGDRTAGFVLATRSAIIEHLVKAHDPALSQIANTRVPVGQSCRTWAGTRPRVIGAALLGAILLALVLAPMAMVHAVYGWILVALIGNGAFKCASLLAFLRRGKIHPPRDRPDRLPRVSIMVPLLRETDILDRLIDRMGALIYPKELLEICLVFEANDDATRQHLASRRLPHWMRKIEVPADSLQTKPRAMNYALDFCRGDIIGIYDAEDAPEPNQVFDVVRRFAGADDRVACVQCALDYYNSRTNWVSRCFTVEYAILFRLILPGLEQMGLPIPLGGTSVFFRRDVLEKLGRWDAQNVTEDADLGIRLHRQGYRCLMVDSTTFEEANFRILPWVRQRSRWLKGFLQTWITHMRHPVALLREVGPGGFLAFQALMVGTFTSFAAAPLVLPMWLMTLGLSVPVYGWLPAPMLTALIVGFVVTEAFLLLLGVTALRQRRTYLERRWVIAMPLYWPIGALAAYKALYELFAHPTYWDKTEHGINDQDCQAEIERLTALPAATNSALPGAETVTGR